MKHNNWAVSILSLPVDDVSVLMSTDYDLFVEYG